MEANRIRETRKRRGMKQKALAAAVGTSQSEISAIEDGRREPGVYLALRIAGELGATVEGLFEERSQFEKRGQKNR
ncbi:MAG: helix-turn-helix transcriptional regulator [Oscillospiraceae bacterium]|nr:helix-turn-helix transcriptional regulator [Oscillospiraceae bacterium]